MSISIEDQIKQIISSHRVVLIQDNNETCGWCIRAKQHLEKLDIQYVSYSPKTLAASGKITSASQEEILAALVALTKGYSFVPMIFIRGQFIGGCQQLEELMRAKKLMKLLHGESKL